MANNVYPPDHLLRKWESLIIDEEQNVDVVLYEVFQAGADQELEACCEWLETYVQRWAEWSADFRADRRPKPPSLKEQALQALDRMDQLPTAEDQHIIRRALEQLND